MRRRYLRRRPPPPALPYVVYSVGRLGTGWKKHYESRHETQQQALAECTRLLDANSEVAFFIEEKR